LRHDLFAADDAMNGLPVARFVNMRLLFFSDGTPSGNVQENVFIYSRSSKQLQLRQSIAKTTLSVVLFVLRLSQGNLCAKRYVHSGAYRSVVGVSGQGARSIYLHRSILRLPISPHFSRRDGAGVYSLIVHASGPYPSPQLLNIGHPSQFPFSQKAISKRIASIASALVGVTMATLSI
jgi:hypothetical protein